MKQRYSNKHQQYLPISDTGNSGNSPEAVVPVLIINSTGKIVSCNDAFASKLGFDLRELKNRKLSDLVVSGFTLHTYNDSLYIFKAKEGGLVTLNLNTQFEIPGLKNKIQYIFEPNPQERLVDKYPIDTQKADEYKSVFYTEHYDHDLKVVFSKTTDKIIWANPAFIKFMGAEAHKITDKSINHIWSGIASSYINTLRKRVIESNQIQTVDIRLEKNGQTHKFVLRMFPLEEDDQCIAIRMIDVSESAFIANVQEKVCKDAEATLNMLDRFVANASNPMVATDASGKVTLVNEALSNLYNISTDQIIGKTITELETEIDGLFCEKFINIVKQILTFESSETVEITIQHPQTNNIMKLNTMGFPLYANDGRIIGCGAIFTDISGFIKQSNELSWTKALAWQYKQEAENQSYLMQTYLDQIPYSTAVINLEGKAIFVNKYIADFWNTTREEIFGKHITEFIKDTKYVNQLTRILDLAVSERRIIEEEITLKRDNNQEKNYIISIFPLIDKDGVVFAAGIHRMDITELKQRELELQESKLDMANARRLLLDFLDNSPYQVIMLNKQHRIVMVNKAFADEINIEREELIGRFYDESIDLKLHRIVGEANEYVIENHKPISFQESMTNHLGKVSIVSVIKFPVYDSNGEFSYVGIVVMDVTDTVTRENELIDARIESERSRQFLQGFMDNATFAMFAKDLNGKFVLANKKKVELLESNKTTNNSLKGDQEDAKVIAEKRPMVFYSTNTSANGIVEYLKTVKFPIYNKHSEIISVGGISNDITDMVIREKELKNAKLKAEKAATAQERFLASMSHDMRTPLNGIVGMINLMEQTKLTEEQFEFLEAMKISSTNLRVLINDILDISKIQAGKLNIESVLFDLKKVISTVTDIFQIEAKKKDIELRVEIAPNTPLFLEGDQIRLNQILNNLIGNAIKFTSKGSVQVNVNYEYQNSQLVNLHFNVIDTGIGISQCDMSKLFQPFVQAGREISRIYGGTGLGLYICKNLIDLQNGTIEVSSRINEGSCFSFSIPYKIIDHEEAVSLQGSLVDTTSSGDEFAHQTLRCLIVEDNQINQKVAYYALKKNGIEADVANNGKEAIDILQNDRDRYDFILMDLQMPETDGYQATKIIRNNLNLKEIPIIAMTASALKGEHERCLEVGMNDFIPKPFMIEELLYIIRHLGIHTKKTNTAIKVDSVELAKTSGEQETGEQLFSISNLEEMNDPEITVEILNDFLNVVPDSLKQIIAHVESDSDWEVIAYQTHKLKGAVSVLQVTKMIEILTIIETSAKSQTSLPEISELLYRCQTLFEKIKTDIIELKKRAEDIINK